MERERCHVCGDTAGVRQLMPDVPPTCPRNDCQLAAAGMISVDEARSRLTGKFDVDVLTKRESVRVRRVTVTPADAVMAEMHVRKTMAKGDDRIICVRPL